MNCRSASDEEIHTAFETGEAAVQAWFDELAGQIAARARQLAQHGQARQALQAQPAKNRRNSSKPPASDG